MIWSCLSLAQSGHVIAILRSLRCSHFARTRDLLGMPSHKRIGVLTAHLTGGRSQDGEMRENSLPGLAADQVSWCHFRMVGGRARDRFSAGV
jgi:hypothetical protein